MAWKEIQPLPKKAAYYEDYLFDASSVVFRDSIYVFGGESGGWRDVVVRYNGKWSLAQYLLMQRDAHRSIVIENTIFHVGGTNQQPPM